MVALLSRRALIGAGAMILGRVIQGAGGLLGTTAVASNHTFLMRGSLFAIAVRRATSTMTAISLRCWRPHRHATH